MERHAGFSLAATMRSEFLESMLHAAALSQGLQFYVLRQTFRVGALDFSATGALTLARPKVRCVANPRNAIEIDLSLEGRVSLAVPIAGVRSWSLRLSTTVETKVQVETIGDETLLKLNGLTVERLQLSATDGSVLPPELSALTQLAALRNSIGTWINEQLDGPLVPPISTRLSADVPRPAQVQGDHSRPWFTLSLEIGPVQHQIVDGGIAIGVNFVGLPTGDVSSLRNLTTDGTLGVMNYLEKRPVFDQPWDSLLASTGGLRGGSAAFAISNAAISHLVAQAFQQISQENLVWNTKLSSLSASYDTYAQPSFSPNGEGLRIRAEAQSLGLFDTSISLVVRPYRMRLGDGDTAWLIANKEIEAHQWFRFDDVDLDLPESAALAAAAILSMFLPFPLVLTFPLVLIGLFVGLSEMALLESNIESEIRRTKVKLPRNFIPSDFIGIKNGEWKSDVRYVTFSKDGPEAAIDAWIELDPNPDAPALIIEGEWGVSDPGPFRISAKLRKDYAQIPNGLTAKWEIRDPRSGRVVLQVAQQIPQSVDSFFVDLNYDNRDPLWYFVSVLEVKLSMELRSGSASIEVCSAQKNVFIRDDIDRTKKYAFWGPHTVVIMNDATGNSPWFKRRRSRIHRTALRARCLELRKQTRRQHDDDFKYYKGRTIQYTDDLGFPWAELNDHRGQLCEYCFFGGPDKTAPFPIEDWH